MSLEAELLTGIDDRECTVVVMGQGYTGLPLSMRAVEAGFPVIGFEVDPTRLGMLREGVSYVEDVPPSELQAALGGRYRPTSSPGDLKGFRVAVVSVPTPLKDGVPDVSFIRDATSTLGRALERGALIVLESTTYPGTTQELVKPILEAESGLEAGTDFFLAYSPERIDPGNPEWDFATIPKVVAGIDEASLRCVEAFYSKIVGEVVPVATTAEAELVKLLENTFRHVNIALVNELAVFANDLGIDIWGTIDAAATKPFGYMPFRPGPGVGGHCLPVDPSYLGWRVRRHLGHTFRFIELANDVNEHMPEYVVTRVMQLLNRERRSVKGSRILLLGATYKAGTADTRESPSLAIVDQLVDLEADLRVCDPHLPPGLGSDVGAPVVAFTDDELSAADLVVIAVNHPEFDVDTIVRESRLIFDAKGMLRGRSFEGEIL